MLRNFTILVFVLMITAATANAQKTGDQSTDETAIRAGVEQMMKGWNAKNGAEFAKPFAEDADYVVINGMQIKGRTAIAKGHQGIFDTVYKNSTISYAIESIRFLRSDIAVIHVFGSLKITEGESTRTGNARMTLVMTKNNGKWEIAAFQNTSVQDTNEAKK